MRAFQSTVLAFAVGFGSCGLTIRLLYPEPVAATSPASFRMLDPSSIVASVGESVVNLEAYSRPAPATDWRKLFSWSRPHAEPEEPLAVASGVILTEGGHVVTNHHVVEGAGRLVARLADGREVEAKLVGSDPHSDLALLDLKGQGYTPAQVGDSQNLRPGMPVIAIGNPLGFENSVSVGVISANRRGPIRVGGQTLGDMIQTDAAINQGNSGGGLFSTDGRLIGINAAIMAARGSSGSIGIGFAIPAHRMRPVVDHLMHSGRMPRPWLGIKYHTPVTAPFTHRLRGTSGVLIQDVFPDSPAAEAGLLPADVVRQLGKQPIRTADDLFTFVSEHRPGEEVTARIIRNGEERTLKLRLGDIQMNTALSSAPSGLRPTRSGDER